MVVVWLAGGLPLVVVLSTLSLSGLDVAEMGTTIATGQEFEVEERQSGLDAVGDGQG